CWIAILMWSRLAAARWSSITTWFLFRVLRRRDRFATCSKVSCRRDLNFGCGSRARAAGRVWKGGRHEHLSRLPAGHAKMGAAIAAQGRADKVQARSVTAAGIMSGYAQAELNRCA